MADFGLLVAVDDCYHVLRAIGGMDYLVCSWTGETKLLPQTDSGWALASDEHTKVPFICAAQEDSRWVYDEMEFVPYREELHEGIERVRLCASGQIVTARSFLHFFTHVKIGLRLLGGGCVFFRCILRDQAILGSRVWWSLHTVAQSCLSPHRLGARRNKQVGRCTDACWYAWLHCCTFLGFPLPLQAQPRHSRVRSSVREPKMRPECSFAHGKEAYGPHLGI